MWREYRERGGRRWPRALGAVAFRTVTLLALPVRLLDLALNRRPAAHALASLTFLRARKPA